MSRTSAQVGKPARAGMWGLAVDNMAHPTEYVVIRYETEGRSHSEPFEQVCRLPFRDGPEALLVEQTGMSKGTANTLGMQLAMKLHSPKTEFADIGYRPVR